MRISGNDPSSVNGSSIMHKFYQFGQCVFTLCCFWKLTFIHNVIKQCNIYWQCAVWDSSSGTRLPSLGFFFKCNYISVYNFDRNRCWKYARGRTLRKVQGGEKSWFSPYIGAQVAVNQFENTNAKAQIRTRKVRYVVDVSKLFWK